MPVPPELEDAIADAAAVLIAPEDIDASPHWPLFELAVQMAQITWGMARSSTSTTTRGPSCRAIIPSSSPTESLGHTALCKVPIGLLMGTGARND